MFMTPNSYRTKLLLDDLDLLASSSAIVSVLGTVGAARPARAPSAANKALLLGARSLKKP